MNNQEITLSLADLFIKFAEQDIDEKQITSVFFRVLNAAIHVASQKSDKFNKISNDTMMEHFMNGLSVMPDDVIFSEVKKRLLNNPELVRGLFNG